jgi:hypothetical protein
LQRTFGGPNVDVHIERIRPFLESDTIAVQYDSAMVRNMDRVIGSPDQCQEIVDWVIRPSVPQGGPLMGFVTNAKKFYGCIDELTPPRKDARSRTWKVFQHMRFLCHWKGCDRYEDYTWEPFWAIANSPEWHPFLDGQPELKILFDRMTPAQIKASTEWDITLCPSAEQLVQFGLGPIYCRKPEISQREIAQFKMDGKHEIHAYNSQGKLFRHKLREPNSFLDWERHFPYAVEARRYGHTPMITKPSRSVGAGRGAGGAGRGAGGAGAAAADDSSSSSSSDSDVPPSKKQRARKPTAKLSDFLIKKGGRGRGRGK